MLARFFKPKWQHHKAEIRLRAISKLSAADPASDEILTQLALQDQDAEVRRTALTRILATQVLLRASQEDSDSQNRTTALQRITHLISGELGQLELAERQALMSHIQTTDLLLHLALNANLPELRQHALLQLEDETLLLDLIRQSDNSDIRRTAAERIEQPELLEQLERESRGRDKRLYRIARDKLQQLRDQAQQAATRQQRRDELLSSLQQLARSDAFPQFGAKLDALNIEWQRYSDDASSDTRQQWQQLDTLCNSRRQQLDQQREAEAAQAAAQAAQQEAIQQLRQQLEAGNEQDPIDKDVLDTLSTQWQQLKADADNVNCRAIESALSTQRRTHDARHALAQQQDALNALISQLEQNLAQANRKQLQQWQKKSDQLRSTVNWPGSLPQPALLKQLSALQSRIEARQNELQQQRSAQAEAADQSLNELSNLIEAGEARRADKQHNQVQKQLASFNPAQQQRYKTLYAQLQELRDWQGYALTPKREALCSQMEALIDTPLATDELAAEIRQLQQQWRELDHSGNVHSRTLWLRFKQASDQAYKPCDTHYAQQRQQRQQNLEQREQMCDQLDSYLSQVDWQDVDWRAVEELSRTAKNEWRHYSPVDRAPGKVQQSRFNKQINTLESRLKGQRKAVQQVKEGLLLEAAALLEMDDLQQATEQAKQLQQRWKEAGTTFRTQERRLWTEFRNHCNALFEKRKENLQQARQQQHQDQSQLSQLCETLSALHQQAARGTDISNELDNLDRQYQALVSQESSLNGGQQKQYQQLSALIHAQLEQRRQLFGSTWQGLKLRDGLCQQQESALLDSSSVDTQAIADAWQAAPPLQGEWADAIERRFAITEQLARQPDELQATVANQGEYLRQLCIRLEIALSEPSPVEDEALRLEYQLQRLQQALKRQQDGYDMADIQQLVFERLCLPFYHCHSELNGRFEQLLARHNLA